MSDNKRFRVKRGKWVHLADIDSGYTGPLKNKVIAKLGKSSTLESSLWREWRCAFFETTVDFDEIRSK